MRDRGERKLLEAYNNNNNNGDDYNYIGENYFPEFPCKKHPGSSSSLASSGICSYCLTDRLAQQLVCSQCGEQKYSNYCSCSNNNTRNMFYTNPDSSTTSADVGRISFLLENDKVDVGGGGNGAEITRSRSIIERRAVDNNHDDYSTHQLRRSNSISTAAVNNNKKNNNNNNKHNNNNNYNNNNVSRAESGKLWKRLFRKKRDKNSHNFNSSSNNNNNNNQNEESNECNGVSRSRSLSSFNRFYDTDQDNGGFAVSSSAARASSVSTGNAVMDSAKISCFSESEARMSNFDYCDAFNFIGPNKSNIFSLRETEFVNSDDHAFIDLKLHDMSSGSSRVPPDLAAMKSGFGFSTKEVGYRGGGGGDGVGHDMFGNNDGQSYRNSSFSERELRKCKKSYKVWKWFFKHQENSGKFGEDNYAFNS